MQLSPARVTRTTVVACSLVSLLPLLVCWQQFARLFFFHDEWEMLDGATRLGLARWLADTFLGDGVFPLFKLLWLGAIHLTGGSYFGMILLLWITHVAICLLFGWLLARFGLTPVAIAFALLTFGLAWTNLETLGWTMQWSPQLGMAFFLGAWHFLLGTQKFDRRAAACFVCLMASALCSTRFIIAGLVLAIFVLVRDGGGERLRLSAVCLAPTALLITAMWLLAPHHMVPAGAALLYGYDYLLANPLFLLLPPVRHLFGSAAALACGALKGVVFVWAIRRAAPTVRPLLWTLMALDVIIAASVGYGRWSMDLATATSSRYQYIPLLCFGTMSGILVARLHRGVQVAALLFCAVALTLPWKRHAEQWEAWRGDNLRAAIAQTASADRFDPSSITAGRARELERLYGLH